MSKPSIVNTKQLLHILFAIFFNWQHWKNKQKNNQVNPVYSVVLCVQHSLLLLIMRTWQIQNATKPFHGFIKLIIQFLPAFKIPKVDDEVGIRGEKNHTKKFFCFFLLSLIDYRHHPNLNQSQSPVKAPLWSCWQQFCNQRPVKNHVLPQWELTTVINLKSLTLS